MQSDSDSTSVESSRGCHCQEQACGPRQGSDQQPAPVLLRLLGFVLDRHPYALLIVDANRILRYRNRGATQLLDSAQGLGEHFDKLSIGSEAADKRLDELLLGRQRGDGEECLRPRGLTVHQPGARRHWHLIVHPLQGCPPTAASETLFLLHLVTRTDLFGCVDPLLRDLFGLSGAEIAAALAVIKTGSAGEAATLLNLSRETVRTQLKAVFRKCDLSSMLELSTLIRSVSSLSSFTLQGDEHS